MNKYIIIALLLLIAIFAYIAITHKSSTTQTVETKPPFADLGITTNSQEE